MSLIVALLAPLQATPAASTHGDTYCTRYGWQKTKVVDTGYGSAVMAEVREHGYWRTSETGKCYGNGLFNQTPRHDIDHSYCAWDSTILYKMHLIWCLATTGRSFWYTDHQGRARYFAFSFRNRGRFQAISNFDPFPASTFTLTAKFLIRYDGEFRKTCTVSDGSVPGGWELRCRGRTGSGTG